MRLSIEGIRDTLAMCLLISPPCFRFWLQLDDFNNTEFDIRMPDQWLESHPCHGNLCV